MAAYDIEFNDEVRFFRCPHFGEESMTMWGWASKDNAVHAAYVANLMTAIKKSQQDREQFRIALAMLSGGEKGRQN